METIHNVMPQQWAHEKITARRLVNEPLPPVEEGMIEREWTPEFEEVQLDAVVIVDRGGETVFKFVLGDALAPFLAHYVPFLDPEGRQVLRKALEETSTLIVPGVDASKLRVLPGGKE